MLNEWMIFNDSLRLYDEFRRRIDHVINDFDHGSLANYQQSAPRWPRANLSDDREAFILQAQVPGLSEQDIQINVTQTSISVAGERKLTAPKGYTNHRQERGSYKFARSFTLPARVDVETVTANVKDGVLTIHLPKHPESKPKSIPVQAHK